MTQLKLLCVAALFVSVSPAFAGKSDCSNEEHYPQISKAELKEVTEKKQAFVVDVNSAESYKKAHVPGAIHYAATKNFAKALPADKSTMIVAYCGGPACTAWKKAAKEACEAGYTNIRHFKEGISGWVAAN